MQSILMRPGRPPLNQRVPSYTSQTSPDLFLSLSKIKLSPLLTLISLMTATSIPIKRRFRQTRLREYSSEANVCIHTNIEPAGDPLVPRVHNDGLTRSGYQNIRGSDLDSGLEVATEVDTMYEIGSDIQGLSETNKPWTTGNKYKYDFMMQMMFGHTVTIYSSAAAHHKQRYQPGGNLLSVTGAAAGRLVDSGSDEWGRHCWAALRGQRDEGVVFITAYRVCQERHNNPGPLTAFSSQYTEMKKCGIRKPNPRKQCLKDLLKLIQQLRLKGFRPALMMDANGDWNHPSDPDDDLK